MHRWAWGVMSRKEREHCATDQSVRPTQQAATAAPGGWGSSSATGGVPPLTIRILAIFEGHQQVSVACVASAQGKWRSVRAVQRSSQRRPCQRWAAPAAPSAQHHSSGHKNLCVTWLEHRANSAVEKSDVLSGCEARRRRRQHHRPPRELGLWASLRIGLSLPYCLCFRRSWQPRCHSAACARWAPMRFAQVGLSI